MTMRRDPLATVGELTFAWAEVQPQQCVWPGRFAEAPDGQYTAAELVCCGRCYRDFIECVDGLVQVLVAAVARELCRDRTANGAVCEECGLELLMLAERGTSLGQVPVDEGLLLQIWLAALIAEGVLTERAATRAEMLVDDTVLERIPEHLRRAFSGSSLAPDLVLPALRDRWGVGSNSRGAWATWVSLTAPDAAFTVRSVSDEAGWRWAHPDLPEREPSPVDVERWPPGSKPPSAVVWMALIERQRGACAMCSIRYAFWPTVHGRPVPPGLLRGPMVIDHDHATGLVRGLLCHGCNGIREPAGARRLDDVWLTYTTEPPAEPFQWRYYMLPQNAG